MPDVGDAVFWINYGSRYSMAYFLTDQSQASYFGLPVKRLPKLCWLIAVMYQASLEEKRNLSGTPQLRSSQFCSLRAFAETVSSV